MLAPSKHAQCYQQNVQPAWLKGNQRRMGMSKQNVVDNKAACSLVDENDELKRKLEAAVKRISRLETINAPNNIPPHVEDVMGTMCDGGFNAQGIWNLCRESIMPPAPCPRCGTVSERPDGVHYCHSRN